ncbi:AAA family ATPase [Amycolatopsis sp. cmx-4-83]|uniref:AAA family ATPase n=1 Tax=Amycolatopsis sp. cmx-4-83 TaxID=2790940 RepID=UPI00397BD20E
MLLERDTERAAIATALNAAAGGDGSLLLISGPAGSGKSALLRDTMAAALGAGARVLRADATRLEEDFAFGIAQQLCRPVLVAAGEAERDRWFQGASEQILRALTEERLITDGHEHYLPTEAVLYGLHTVVHAMSHDDLVVVIVDDLQWADQGSLRLLGYLAKRLSGSRILLALALADECEAPKYPLVHELVTAAARIVVPAPLSRSGVASMAEVAFGERAEEPFTAMLHEVSGGNPADVATVLTGLVAEGLRPVAAQTAAAETEAVRLLDHRVLMSLGSQPPAVLALARAVAVLGDLAEPGLAADLVGLDDVEYSSAVQHLERLGLVDREDGRIGFVTTSVRDGIESAIPVELREDLYRRAARLLYEHGRPAERVAETLMKVGIAEDPWEVRILSSAAGSVLERGAGELAARYLRRALLNTAPDSEERGRLLVELAAAERGFDLVAAARHLSQALSLLPPGPQQAEAALWIPPAYAAAAPNLGAAVRAAVEPVLRAGEPVELALRAEARTWYPGIGQPGRGEAALARLAELEHTGRLDAPAGRELAVVLLHTAVLSGSVPVDDVETVLKRLVSEEPLDPRHAYTSLPLLVSTSLLADNAAVLEPALTAAAQAAQEHWPDTAPLIAAELAEVKLAQGELAKARRIALGVLEGTDHEAWPDALARSVTTLAQIALETQDPELGERLLGTPMDGTDHRVFAARRLTRGMIDLVRGDPATALGRFLDCGRRLEREGWVNTPQYPWRIWAALVQQRLGDLAAAQAHAAEEDQFAQHWGTPLSVGRSLRLQGMLTGGADGIALLQEAAGILRESENVVERARTAVVLGARLLDAGLPEAEDLLAEGRELVKAIGASWLDGSGETELNGPVLRFSGDSLGNLTKTEAAVARLVVQGWTNQRIADSLGVTRRAVEKNLTGTYRKLEVSGRAELIERFGALEQES